MTGLDPGVVRLVTGLRSEGFQTTDSGDGVSKPADARAMDVPHVFIRCDSVEHGISEARRLLLVLMDAGLNVERDGWDVQLSWSPLNNVAVVLLTGVSDADLGAAS